jgi:hypothetical protein
MNVVAAEFVDKAHFPALRDHFSAPIAVAQNRVRQKQKTSRFGAVARAGNRRNRRRYGRRLKCLIERLK